MSKSSKAVINWRQRTKQRIVDAMGGKCYCCEYSGCNAVFDLHHLDPSQKHFSFGGIRANPIAWSRIVEELRKCILVCSNCHREIEDGYRVLVNPKSTFNENFIEYSQEIKITVTRKNSINRIFSCRNCGRQCQSYSVRQLYCSEVCKKIYTWKESEKKNKIRQRPRKTVWPEKEDLAKLLETETWVAIGKKFGVSDNAVRKWARSYKLI